MLLPPVHLACGGFVSIQASAMHYCNPRDDQGPYTEWELGLVNNCPREAVALLEGYDGDIAAYVPTATVKAFVAACGGEVNGFGHPALA